MDNSKGLHMSCGRICAPDQFLPVAFPNDPGLLTEIQSFSENDSIFNVQTGKEHTISGLALEVVCWLQVCLIPHHSGRPPRFFPITTKLLPRDVTVHRKQQCHFGKDISLKKTSGEISRSSPKQIQANLPCVKASKAGD